MLTWLKPTGRGTRLSERGNQIRHLTLTATVIGTARPKTTHLVC